MSVRGWTESPTAIHTRIGSQSEVEQLARGLKTRVESLAILILEDIVLDVEDKTGLLDPILLALAPVHGEPRGPLSWFRLSCVEAASNGVSVVSPEALGAIFAEVPAEMPTIRRNSYLNHLGLNDNHCEAMVHGLARDDALTRSIDLNLTGNQALGQQGYVALLGLLNRRFDINGVDVDDQNWKPTFDLVVYMNHEHRRGFFLENGVFASKATWVEFLAGLSAHHYWSEVDEAQKLNAIWYTLREYPDLIGS